MGPLVSTHILQQSALPALPTGQTAPLLTLPCMSALIAFELNLGLLFELRTVAVPVDGGVAGPAGEAFLGVVLGHLEVTDGADELLSSGLLSTTSLHQYIILTPPPNLTLEPVYISREGNVGFEG